MDSFPRTIFQPDTGAVYPHVSQSSIRPHAAREHRSHTCVMAYRREAVENNAWKCRAKPIAAWEFDDCGITCIIWTRDRFLGINLAGNVLVVIRLMWVVLFPHHCTQSHLRFILFIVWSLCCERA